MTERRATVVGLGLIGGSLGAALRRSGYMVTGYDISARHARTAQELGLVDDVAGNLPNAVSAADVVILAVPVLRIIDLLPVVDTDSPSHALVLDTGSVKRVVVDAMECLPGAERMVGGHPLAGKERSGPQAADADLFAGSVFFLTPSSRTSAETLRRAQEIVESVGATVEIVPSAEHDRVLAGSSHLPQVLASTLAATVHPPSQFAGPGFRDMTRLAGSDPTMWRDILLTNGDEIVSVGREYTARLGALLSAIELGNVPEIESLLGAGTLRTGAEAHV